MWEVGQSPMYDSECSVTFTASIFLKLLFAQCILVDILCTEFHPNRSITAEIVGRDVFRPSSATWLSFTELWATSAAKYLSVNNSFTELKKFRQII